MSVEDSPARDPVGESSPVHLAVALDGTGWHPASWREPDARPTDLLDAGYWADLVTEAERGHLDFVTIEDALTLQYEDPSHVDDRVDRVRGRLDAVLIASRVAPLTRHIGVLPTAVVTHTEPFHLSKAIATLDYVSLGRAGVRVQVTASPEAARHFGRRDITQTSPAELITEAADYVEVLRRLWDSWEDDAEIRDVATGRFVDRTKLHYIDFEGASFSVRGPSITPRPPQGQPVVAALSHGEATHSLIARSADVGFVTPRDTAEVTAVVDAISARARVEGRSVLVFADLVVVLDQSPARAQERRRRLDERAGSEFTSDAGIFTGTPAQLADLIEAWHSAGAAGLRLRPATLPHDLTQITDGLVPELQRRRVFRGAYGATLREILGLSRPANRYTSV
ncbi:LLM class flavin-dependent oxidoreductase [Mycolicibacterium sp. BiH015]|uniref:LLM class flavin-dependent oxidoreductase n=1 Tax=Mycolicibacterium sp. BiH015 TaxID=3018808 RepID=UPI0022DFB03D|nr:LLM class flavin-dependent oxidoreductase [Mycolicibacterium sp. BiH015]MDA2890164.1 LLM class flavin-dependent oxidoreductase [Mycolicibacterium sp. BiH015]